jgi:hypothetical protein
MLGVGKIVDHEFLDWGGAEGQVDGAFMRNISNHSDLANGSARNDVGEPGKRGSDSNYSKLGRHVASID